MRRLLLAALAASLCAAPVSAEGRALRLGGQIDLQATSARDITDFKRGVPGNSLTTNDDRLGDAQVRLLLKLDWDPLDDVHLRVTLKGNATAGGIDADGPGTNDIRLEQYLREASFKVDKVAGVLDATMGRQYYGDAGDAVIHYGPSDKAWYGLPDFPIDAVRVDLNGESFGATGLVGKTVGHPIGVVTEPDTDLHGGQLMFRAEEKARAALFVWNRQTHRVTGVTTANFAGLRGGDTLWVVGLKGRLAVGGFWLRGLYARNFGKRQMAGSATVTGNPDYRGQAFLVNSGYKLEDDSLGSVALWSEFAHGSGEGKTEDNRFTEFTPINGDYRPGSIYGRFAANSSFDGLGSGVSVPVGSGAVPTGSSALSNRVIWGGGLRASPAAATKLSAAVSYWDFRIQRFTRANYAQKDFRGNSHIGSELDVDLIWTHSENVAFSAGYATFWAGGLIKESAQRAVAPYAPRSVRLVYFDTRVRF